MSVGETGSDGIVGGVAAVFSKARVATAVLRDTVIPAMPPARRTFPQGLVRRIDRGDMFSEGFVQDLEVFIETLEWQVENATVVGWEADENHNAGGFEVLYRSDDGVALAAAVRDLEELRDLISLTLDVIRAHAFAEALTTA